MVLRDDGADDTTTSTTTFKAPQEGHELEKTHKEDPITVAEIEAIAKRKLRPEVFNYYACGSDDQIAVRDNVEVFDRIKILPRFLRDVSAISTSTTLFGRKYPVPFGIAPSAMQKLAGGEGEIDVARAAVKDGVNMTLSSQATSSLEDVIEVRDQEVKRRRRGNENENDRAVDGEKDLGDGFDVPGFWMQLYMTADPEKSVPLVKRAEAAGYEALVLTIDTPVLGNRLNERKTPLTLPSHLRLANLNPQSPSPSSSSSSSPPAKNSVKEPSLNRRLMDSRTRASTSTLLHSPESSTLHSPSLTWTQTLPFLRRTAPSLHLILKGILTPHDARLAIAHGASAIWISNHGGRQLDSAPSTLEVLPAIVEAVDGRVPVLFDGGVRRGSDVFKALALGADFVMVGRAVLWGLALGEGEQGVRRVLDILERELSRTMALAGVTDVGGIGREAVGVRRTEGFGIVKL